MALLDKRVASRFSQRCVLFRSPSMPVISIIIARSLFIDIAILSAQHIPLEHIVHEQVLSSIEETSFDSAVSYWDKEAGSALLEAATVRKYTRELISFNESVHVRVNHQRSISRWCNSWFTSR